MSPSDQWLFDQLNAMRQESTDQHQRLRSDVNSGFDKIREELKGHHADLDRLDKRVMKIEIQRDDESRSVARRQWGIGVLVSVLLWVLSQLAGAFKKAL